MKLKSIFQNYYTYFFPLLIFGNIFLGSHIIWMLSVSLLMQCWTTEKETWWEIQQLLWTTSPGVHRLEILIPNLLLTQLMNNLLPLFRVAIEPGWKQHNILRQSSFSMKLKVWYCQTFFIIFPKDNNQKTDLECRHGWIRKKNFQSRSSKIS